MNIDILEWSKWTVDWQTRATRSFSKTSKASVYDLSQWRTVPQIILCHKLSINSLVFKIYPGKQMPQFWEARSIFSNQDQKES